MIVSTFRLALFVAIASVLSLSAYQGFTETQNGSGKTGSSGAPGDQTCASCHNPASGGNGSLVISGGVAPNGYDAGQTYNMSVTITHTGSSKFGFNLVALDSNNASIGTLTAGSGSQVLNGPSSRKNLTHTSSGSIATTAGSKVYNFTWTAPTTYAGRVTFYAAGNAANGDGGTGGDFVYTGTLTAEGNAVTAVMPDVESSFSIYPNPIANGNAFHLISEAEPTMVEIVNLKGEVIRRYQKDQEGMMISTAGLSTGIYLVRLSSGEHTAVQKLIVQD